MAQGESRLGRWLAMLGGAGLLLALFAGVEAMAEPPFDAEKLREERSRLRSIAREGALLARLAATGAVPRVFGQDHARDLAREALRFFSELESGSLPSVSEPEARRLAAAAVDEVALLRALERSTTDPASLERVAARLRATADALGEPR